MEVKVSIALFSGRIYTAVDELPTAEALLIEKNTIVAVGTNSEIKKKCTKDTQQIDLAGKFVAPGFIDAHTHVWSMGYLLSMVDLRGLTSLAACQEAIARKAEKASPGEWIIGRNWNQNIWDNGQEPDRHDLDRVTPNNPAVMIRICGHASWVNSRALGLAGVTADTPEPQGGKIEREPGTRMPSGIIRETRELVEYLLPEPGPEMKKQAFLKCQDLFFQNGITCVHSFETLEEYRIIKEIERSGKLKLRVYHSLPPEDLELFDKWEKTTTPQSDLLWHGHTKLFADGSLGAKSAYLHAPYSDTNDDWGIACLTPDQMQQDIELSYSMGRSVIVHAIGDRAVTETLNAIEKARQKYPGPKRDRIEHIQLCCLEDLVRMEQMDIAASVQPMAIQTDRDVAERIWGDHRCGRAYAWKTMADKGLRLIFSSDAPIEPINPMAAIQTAVTRKNFTEPDGQSWHPEQCLSAETALKGYFEHGGWASGKEAFFGSIQPGKRGDLTILSRDPRSVAADKIKDIAVEMTLVDGEIVFSV